MEKIKVYLQVERENCIPKSGSTGSAGADIVAAEDSIILPGQTKLISTGIKTAIPAGYEIQIRPRSGLSLNTSLRIANSPGTIDSDYRDEIKVICHNAFNFSDWKTKLFYKPELIKSINQLTSISYWEYLKSNSSQFFDQIEASQINDSLFKILQEENIYLDEDGYPLGTIKIKEGERIAQMVFAKYLVPQFETVADVSTIGDNRGGGFGSTGKI